MGLKLLDVWKGSAPPQKMLHIGGHKTTSKEGDGDLGG